MVWCVIKILNRSTGCECSRTKANIIKMRKEKKTGKKIRLQLQRGVGGTSKEKNKRAKKHTHALLVGSTLRKSEKK